MSRHTSIEKYREHLLYTSAWRCWKINRLERQAETLMKHARAKEPVDPRVLSRLKASLARFNSHTYEWKEKEKKDDKGTATTPDGSGNVPG